MINDIAGSPDISLNRYLARVRKIAQLTAEQEDRLRFGLSRERVRQLEVQALKRLRVALGPHAAIAA